MRLILDLGYLAAGLLASPFLLFKLAADRRYRHHLRERFGRIPRRSGDADCLWFHCASVGEVNVIRPLVRELQKRRPGTAIHVSTLTMAGREQASKAFPEAGVHYFPIDLSFFVRRALSRVRPAAIILAELELWPNFTAAAAGRGIPIVVINGRLSARSHRRYRRTAWLWRRVFGRITRVGAQSETHAQRFRDLGARDVLATGNLKYDTALLFDPAQARAEMSAALGLGGAPLLIGGSTHDPEEKLLIAAFRTLRAAHPRLRLLIAPRHLERVAEVERLIAAAGFAGARRSSGVPPADSIIVLDTVGELAKMYAAADTVFIGGTFCARGGQNMLEPASLAKPIVSGPGLENFREIAEALVAGGGLRVIQDPAGLGPAIGDLLADPERARAMGEQARRVADSGRGAIEATLRLIDGAVPR